MDWSEYIGLLREKKKASGLPLSASFELTPFCNFNCNMCYIHLSPEQAKAQGTLLNTDQWLRIGEETKRLGALGLEITGGEALTRPDFPILYEEYIKLGYLITIRSNGYLIHDEILELLKRYKPRCVSITLYGASNETYRNICGIYDGFSVVTRNTCNMRDAGINLRLSVTLTKDNVDDKKRLIEWANDNGFLLSFYGGLITPIRAAKRSIQHLKVDNYSNYCDIETPKRMIQDREKYSSPFWMCKEYGTGFCISWDGRMTLCNCLPSIWTDSLSQNIGDAYKSLGKLLAEVRRPPECANCPYIDFCCACPALLLSETGNHEQTCGNVCKIAKNRYNRFLQANLLPQAQGNNINNSDCLRKE